MNAITLLQKDIHAHIGIDDSNFTHIQQQNIVPVVLHEFVRVAQEYPIVFVKSAESGQFQPVAVLGIKTGTNLFVKSGKWVGAYQPLSVRNAPFCLVPEEEGSDRLLIGINETSPRIGLDGGEKLFTDSGDESEFFAARKAALIDYFEKEQVSQPLTHLLATLDLLGAQSINLNVAGSNVNLNGIYIVDEEKLNNLPDEQFLMLRQRGVLPSIYAHLLSGQRWERLVSLSAAAE